MKDYRARQKWRTGGLEIDAALNAQLLDLLKQAAIEEGQWGATKPDDDPV